MDHKGGYYLERASHVMSCAQYMQFQNRKRTLTLWMSLRCLHLCFQHSLYQIDKQAKGGEKKPLLFFCRTVQVCVCLSF